MRPDFKVWVEELFEPFGRVTVKRFFGGGGIYLGDTMFALIGGDTIHLKSDESTRAEFVAEGCEEFRWTNPRTGGVWESGYFTLPDRLFDDREELAHWAAKALAAARRAKAARPARRRAAGRKKT